MFTGNQLTPRNFNVFYWGLNDRHLKIILLLSVLQVCAHTSSQIKLESYQSTSVFMTVFSFLTKSIQLKATTHGVVFVFVVDHRVQFQTHQTRTSPSTFYACPLHGLCEITSSISK